VAAAPDYPTPFDRWLLAAVILAGIALGLTAAFLMTD
jgi:hypothetical protein